MKAFGHATGTTWTAIVYEEVSAAHLDTEHCPGFSDLKIVTEWCEIEFFDMAADAIDEPLTESE